MEQKTVSVAELEELCTCWVCFEPFVEPITLQCGHTLCKDCTIAVLKKTALCPFCRHPFAAPLPPVNRAIVALVERLHAARAGAAAVDVAADKLSAAHAFPLRQDSTLVNLPPEALRHILAQCDAKDLANVSLTCRAMREKTADPLLWREMCRDRWPFVSIDRYHSWRACFIAHTRIQRGWGTGAPGDFHVATFRGHTGYITDLQLYRSLLVTTASDHTARIWRASPASASSDTSFSRTDEALHVLEGHEDAVTCVRFDEAAVVTGSADRTARFWDLTTGAQTAVFRTTAAVSALCYAGDTLVVGAANGLVKQWDCKTGVCTHIHAPPAGAGAAAAGPVQRVCVAGRDVYAVGADAVRVYDATAGALRLTVPHTGAACCVDAPRHALLLAGADGAVTVWDTATGALRRTYAPAADADAGEGSALTTLACDGAHVVAGDEAGRVGVWDAATGVRVRTLADHRARVNALQMDGRKLVTASADNSIKVWDLGTGRRQYTLLGGTLQRRQNVPEHPTLQGIGMMHFDESRIVAGMRNLVRVYDFEVLPETAMV